MASADSELSGLDAEAVKEAMMDFSSWANARRVNAQIDMPETVRLGQNVMRLRFEALCKRIQHKLPIEVIQLAIRLRVVKVTEKHWLCLDFQRYSHKLPKTTARMLSLLMHWWNTPLRILLYHDWAAQKAVQERVQGPGTIGEISRKSAWQGLRDMHRIESLVLLLR